MIIQLLKEKSISVFVDGKNVVINCKVDDELEVPKDISYEVANRWVQFGYAKEIKCEADEFIEELKQAEPPENKMQPEPDENKGGGGPVESEGDFVGEGNTVNEEVSEPTGDELGEDYPQGIDDQPEEFEEDDLEEEEPEEPFDPEAN